VRSLQLKHGEIRFEDRSPAHQTSTLSDIDLRVHDFDPTRIQGRLTVGKLKNPVYTAQRFDVEWALKDIDPSLAHLNGTLTMKQAEGAVHDLNNLVKSSKSAKLALMPLVALQSLDKLGIVNLGLPDFSHLEIAHITGDYAFQSGTMKINQFQIVGPQLTVGSRGTVQLASENLALDVNLHTSKGLDLQTHISGTLTNPQTNLDQLKKKAFKATLKQITDRPEVQKSINDALQHIFK
jgi:uncharacterized protein YhdP